MADDSENQTPAEEPASETPKAKATKAKATALEGQPAEAVAETPAAAETAPEQSGEAPVIPEAASAGGRRSSGAGEDRGTTEDGKKISQESGSPRSRGTEGKSFP